MAKIKEAQYEYRLYDVKNDYVDSADGYKTQQDAVEKAGDELVDSAAGSYAVILKSVLRLDRHIDVKRELLK